MQITWVRALIGRHMVSLATLINPMATSSDVIPDLFSCSLRNSFTWRMRNSEKWTTFMLMVGWWFIVISPHKQSWGYIGITLSVCLSICLSVCSHCVLAYDVNHNVATVNWPHINILTWKVSCVQSSDYEEYVLGENKSMSCDALNVWMPDFRVLWSQCYFGKCILIMLVPKATLWDHNTREMKQKRLIERVLSLQKDCQKGGPMSVLGWARKDLSKWLLRGSLTVNHP